MPKNREQIVELALRELRLLSVDENADSDQIVYVGDKADLAYAEFLAGHLAVTWTLDEVPDSVAGPFSMLVASDVAAHYNVPSPSRSRALGRIMTVLRPDDREDSRDLDGDGTISDDEADAAARAAFY